MKWDIDNPDIGLKIKPKIKFNDKGEIIWKLVDISDTIWGSIKNDGKSVTGYILYFMGVSIVWKSKGQKLYALSSSEAEYIAISEMVKKIEFVRQLIKNFGIQAELSILLIVNNMGAIYIARNNTSETGTKHVNIRFHYVRDLHDSHIIVLQFVKSENNESDIMTKNPTQKSLRGTVQNWWE